MKNWTIRSRILGSFGLILLLMMGMGGMTLLYLKSIGDETHAVESDSVPGLAYSAKILVAILHGHLLTQHHVISVDKSEMAAYEVKIRENRELTDGLLRQYEPTILTEGDREIFSEVALARSPYLATQERILELSMALRNKEAHALYFSEFEPQFEKLDAALDKLAEFNEVSATSSIQHIRASTVQTMNAIALCVVVAVGLAFLICQSLFHAIHPPLKRLVEALNLLRKGDFTERMNLERRDEFGTVADGFDRMIDELAALVGQVQKSGLQVTSSVTEVSATAKQQQATAKEIAATTAEIGATSQEISATSKELAKTMGEVSAVAERSAALAGNGQAGLAHMEETMHQVMEATGSITQMLAVLNEKAGNINQVITTITKVADQTNLLSLNAAIEAEKAGEHGRGFAVVATEIRRLADQTSVATYDIEQTVKEIQSAVSASVMGMDKFSEEVRRGMQEVQQVGGQLSEIIQQVQALAPRFEAVNEGMRAQASGAEQITQALAQLKDAAQQTVESLQESTAAIDQLNQVANGLRGGVSRFKLSAAA